MTVSSTQRFRIGFGGTVIDPAKRKVTKRSLLEVTNPDAFKMENCGQYRAYRVRYLKSGHTLYFGYWPHRSVGGYFVGATRQELTEAGYRKWKDKPQEPGHPHRLWKHPFLNGTYGWVVERIVIASKSKSVMTNKMRSLFLTNLGMRIPLNEKTFRIWKCSFNVDGSHT